MALSKQQKYLVSGIFGYITKPIKFHLLIKIKSFFGKKVTYQTSPVRKMHIIQNHILQTKAAIVQIHIAAGIPLN